MKIEYGKLYTAVKAIEAIASGQKADAFSGFNFSSVKEFNVFLNILREITGHGYNRDTRFTEKTAQQALKLLK